MRKNSTHNFTQIKTLKLSTQLTKQKKFYPEVLHIKILQANFSVRKTLIQLDCLDLMFVNRSQLRRSGSLVHTNTQEDVPDAAWDNAIAAQVVVVNLSHCKSLLSDR